MENRHQIRNRLITVILSVMMLITMIPVINVYGQDADDEITLKIKSNGGYFEMWADPNILKEVKSLIIERNSEIISYNAVTPDNINMPSSYCRLNDNFFFSAGNKPKKGDILIFRNEEDELIAKFKCDFKDDKGTFFERIKDKEEPEPQSPGTDPEEENPEQPAPQDDAIKSVEKTNAGWGYYAVKVEPSSELQNIEFIYLNQDLLEKTSSKVSVFGKKYCIADDKIYFDPGEIKEGKVVTFKKGENTLGKFRVEKDGSFTCVKSQELTDKLLHVKLEGYFEPAILTQTKYDAVTAATGNATSNKNSDVHVYVAESEKDEAPENYDWKLIKDASSIHMENSTAVIEEVIRKKDSDGKEVVEYKTVSAGEMGMAPVYHTVDSSISLGGDPKKAGEYRITVLAKDELGREAISNSISFSIYDVNGTKLSSQLQKVEEAINGSTHPQIGDNGFIHYYNGKNVWMQSPWRIALFDHDTVENDLIEKSAEVTVPNKLNIWKGSDTSGLYADLGFPMKRYTKKDGIKEGQFMPPVQHLVIEDGTDLTMSNMKIYSSVNIIIKKGGSLNFDDSSTFGNITVEDGGTLKLNYDEKEKKYTSGAQVNGQIVLKDGAILEDSLIYSNANNLTDDGKARFIEHPVVRIEGKVTVKGKVYIRGDEAATGVSKITGETYAGQPAMELAEGAELHIPEGSEVGVYGGGYNVTTTNGGDALLMNAGSKITGEGKLIAVAGNGHFTGKGGTAIKGEGEISIAEAFIQGGYSSGNSSPVGKAHSEGISFSRVTKGYAHDGKNGSPDADKNPWWRRGTVPGNEKHEKNDCLNFSKTDGADVIYPDGFEIKPENKKIEIPDAEKNLIYNGEVQLGVRSGEGYILSGSFKAKNAGSYTATAILKDGFIWDDDSSDAKTIKWTIEKAKQAAPKELHVENANKGKSDGKIKNTTMAMEYFYETPEGEPKVCSDVETAGLKPGIYYVRFIEDENHNAGEALMIEIKEKSAAPVAPNLSELKQRTKPIDRTMRGYEVEAYDIFFSSEETPDTPVTLVNPIKVYVRLKKIKVDKDNLHIFHEKASGEMEEIKDFDVEGDTVIFTASDFSPYLFASKKISQGNTSHGDSSVSKAEKEDINSKSGAPRTGDRDISSELVIMLLAVSGMVAILVKYSKAGL